MKNGKPYRQAQSTIKVNVKGDIVASNNQNLWEKNNIPALEYCSISRAADILKCSVNDLLHWAEIGAIEICLELNGYNARIALPIIEITNKINDESVIKEIYTEWFQCQLYKVFTYDDPIPIDYAPLSQIRPKWEFGEISFKDGEPIIYLHGLWSLCVDIPVIIEDA